MSVRSQSKTANPLSDLETSEAAIFRRIVQLGGSTLSSQVAREILEVDFHDDDKQLVNELAAQARNGSLSENEQQTIDRYEQVGHLLNILQSKARRSLREDPEPSRDSIAN